MINKMLTGLFLLLCANLCFGQSVCDTVYSESLAIAELRQSEYPLQQLLKVYADSKPAQQLIISAYEQPVYLTEQGQQTAVQRFANQALLDCVKNPDYWLK